MINIIFLFGTLSGLIVVGGIIATIVTAGGQPEMSDHSLFLGYLIMVLALSMIFFGVKRYRDRDLGGVIKFMPAFLMGVGISVVAGVIYVLVWEVYMAATNYAFTDAFAQAMVNEARTAGKTGEELAKVVKQAEDFKVQYADPLFRMPMTFIEIFPVGLVISLISAALLRNPKVLPANA